MRSDHTADPTANYHQGDIFSVAAHESIADVKQQLRARVVAYIANCGDNGATSDQVERDLHMPHQTVSARITEAKARGEVIPSGQRRLTRSGRSAAVLVAAHREVTA